MGLGQKAPFSNKTRNEFVKRSKGSYGEKMQKPWNWICALTVFLSCNSPASDESHHDVETTLFWIGESRSQDNGEISNSMSAWDAEWIKHFGGLDDPVHRNGYLPSGFTPSENPFYVALPYNDFDENGKRRSAARLDIPWAVGLPHSRLQSWVKNRWLKITYKTQTCYGQWEDVGPYEENDPGYIFFNNKPKSIENHGAALDVSPALRDCLQLSQNFDRTQWSFVRETEVPQGPWTQIITQSAITESP